MSVALEELGKLNEKRAEGESVDPNELAAVLRAVHSYLGKAQEREEVLIANQMELQRQMEEMRREKEIMQHTLENMQHDIPDEDRKKSKAKAASMVQRAAVNAKHFRTASDIDYRLKFMQEPKETVVWEGDPYLLEIRNVQFMIRRGHNELPKSAAEAVKRKISAFEERAARDSVYKIGRRRGGRKILTVQETEELNRDIDRHFRMGKANLPVVQNEARFITDYMESDEWQRR